MERASKLVVVLWAVAALAVEVLLQARAWGELLPLSAGVFLLFALASWFDRRAIAAVLIWTCVFPVFIRLMAGGYSSELDVLWLAGLVAVMVPDGLRRSWQMPAVWRGPLVCGVLVVVVSTPIVCWRELDFNMALLAAEQVSNTSVGGAPHNVIAWIVHVALVLVVGVLWFDWLCGLDDPGLFRRYVLVPMGLSAAAMVGVAIYQLVVDVQFLNETVYSVLGRASGTVFDANVCGAVAALWIGGAACYASTMKRGHELLRASALIAGWLGVWATGSRTGLLAAVVVTAFVLTDLLRSHPLAHIGSLRRAIGLALVLVALLAVVASRASGVVGPWQRIRATLPSASSESVGRFVREIWARNEYGTVGTMMVKDFPWFGIGVGCFHLMVADYSRLISPDQLLPTDNAQNWLRHQAAELGVVGSLGWVVWFVGFAWFVLKPQPAMQPGARLARGALVAFGLVSMVGMPGQESLVAVIFWTLAYWYTKLAGRVGSAAGQGAPALLAPRAWAMIGVVVTVHAAGTVGFAATSLRVPHRAQRVGWPYSYGLYEPERAPDGGTRRWTTKRAVAVADASTKWLELTLEINHPDIATKPVDVKVWADDVLVVSRKISSAQPVSRTVALREGQRRVVLETEVSRTARPRDYGLPDDRDLGLLIGWRFRSEPPASQGPSN